jgi:flagellar biosynthesis repressor protein FlbT
MKNALKISLKPGERLFLNGAVIRVDRKVTVELMNDVQFLLEAHVLQAEHASTPLRQLYFMLQVMLMNPSGAPEAHRLFRQSLPLLLASFVNERILAGLKQVDRLVAESHVFEALKLIRSLYPLEEECLRGEASPPAAPDAGPRATVPRVFAAGAWGRAAAHSVQGDAA